METTKTTLTVFTPAYNRSHTLVRTFGSLCSQTSKDFKWIIVDDGSTDCTRELVESWLKIDNDFQIEYYWKKNEGMASGHNEAYKHIDTELAVCIDSDDWMPNDGVEKIITLWKQNGGEQYAGMIAQDFFENGSMVASPFPNNVHSCKAFDLKNKYGVSGDVKFVFRTDVIKKYLPYPIFAGEKYLEVNYLYSVISKDYDYLCYNDCFCIVEYQPDGLTAGIMRQYVQSPNSYLYTRNEYIKCLPLLKDKFRHAIHYVSSAMFAKDWNFFKKTSRKDLVLAALPLGILLHCYIKYKNK